MFSCPKLKVNATNAPAPEEAKAPTSRSESESTILTWPPTASTPWSDWIRLSSVPDPGRVVWFADAGGDVTGDWKEREDIPGTVPAFSEAPATNGKGVMPRHGGKINVGFVDGHVSLVSPSEINWGSTDTNRRKFIGFTKFE